MGTEVIWTCDLCSKQDSVDFLHMQPFDWSEITVKWGRSTRTGIACDVCTSTYKIPDQGLLKYWKSIIVFLRGYQ